MESFALNQNLALALNHWANSSLYASNLAIFAAVYLPWGMFIGLGFLVWDARRRFRAFRVALLSAAAGLLALFAADLIKDILPAARPFAALKGIEPLFQPADLAAFPSSHAAFFGGLAMFLSFRNPRTGAWYLLAAGLMAIGRIAAGVHWPLDMLAGFSLAALAGWLISRLGHKIGI
jgi:undecaprenyl-diphosphatase